MPLATANPNASATAKAILNWFSDLPSRSDNRVVIGQFGSYGDGTSDVTAQNQLNKIFNASGVYPALTGMDYARWDNHPNHFNDFTEPNEWMKQKWNEGYLISCSWHAWNPFTNSASSVAYQAYPLENLYTTGTAENTTWMSMLSYIADALEDLQNSGVVVIWRPLHECNGGWFWWHQSEPASKYINLWRHMFNYFTNTRGLNNLLWLYNGNRNNNQWNRRVTYYYPGANYVDMVGYDVYLSRTTTRNEDPILANQWQEYSDCVATGKPVSWSEFGPTPSDSSGWQAAPHDSTIVIRDIKALYPQVTMVQWWEYIWQLGNQANIPQLLNDSWSITRNELPDFDQNAPPDSTPAQVILSSPGNGTVSTDPRPAFSWASAAGATTYRIQIDDNPDFSSPFIETTTGATSFTPSLDIVNGTHYWRVRGENSTLVGAWSSARSVVISSVSAPPVPSAPTLNSPAAEAQLTDTSPTFQWSEASGASGYYIYISASATFETIMLTGQTSATQYTFPSPTNDLPNGTYYWRVRGYNSSGNGSYSATRSFTITSETNAPPISIPTVDAEGVCNPTLLYRGTTFPH